VPTLDKETRQLLNKVRSLGGKGIPVYLEDVTLIRLCAVVAVDLNRRDLVEHLISDADLTNGYYGAPLDWFEQPLSTSTSLAEVFSTLREKIENFVTYFKCLCSLHLRRTKFERILERQALPKMEQIVPRSLLEYGLRPSETLASWLVWRKWLYDIDNRSAQETGYLFEPILAAAIGGVPQSAKTSLVRRRGDATKGRQVDCLDERIAYEFKMRVTIAASGQGRFGEELDFAEDCRASGFTPVLLVLDPTPSDRLDELTKAYEAVGGRAYIGDEAWDHIEAKAGDVMGLFVERYVRTPIKAVDEAYGNTLLPISILSKDDEIVIDIGGQVFSVSRTGPKVEADDDDDDE
jgi:hypothetical protein